MVNYKDKYLKYKFKYLKLIQQGGMFITPTHSAYWDYAIDPFGNNDFLNDLEPAHLLKLIIKEYKNYPGILEPYLISNKERLRIYIAQLSDAVLSQLINNNIKSYLNNNLIEFEQIEEIINNNSDLKKIKDIGEDTYWYIYVILWLSVNSELITKTLFDLHKIYTILNAHWLCVKLITYLNKFIVDKNSIYLKPVGTGEGDLIYLKNYCENNFFNNRDKIKELIEEPYILLTLILNNNYKTDKIINYFTVCEGTGCGLIKTYPTLQEVASLTYTDYSKKSFYINLEKSFENNNFQLFKEMYNKITYTQSTNSDVMFIKNCFNEEQKGNHPFIDYINRMLQTKSDSLNLEFIKQLDIYKNLLEEEDDLGEKIASGKLSLIELMVTDFMLYNLSTQEQINEYLEPFYFNIYKNLHNRKEHINNLIKTIQTAVSFEYITFDLE